MKKMFTLIFSLGILTSVFAQSGDRNWHDNQRNGRNGYENRGSNLPDNHNNTVYREDENRAYNENDNNSRSYSFNNRETRGRMKGWDTKHSERREFHYNPYTRSYGHERIYNDDRYYNRRHFRHDNY